MAEITRLTEAIDEKANRIGDRRQVAPTLRAMPGCAELTAAKLIGETAAVPRFKSDAAFARHDGTAPIPVWSGNTAGPTHEPWRQPPTQRRPAPHRSHPAPQQRSGQADYETLQTGKSKRDALRILSRRLSSSSSTTCTTTTKTGPGLTNVSRLT